jgi:hypothetical protein
VPVVEAPGEAKQAIVERVPQVVLDAERLAAGDETAPDEHERLQEAREREERDEDRQKAPILVRERMVDRVPRDPRDREAGRLGTDRKHD